MSLTRDEFWRLCVESRLLGAGKAQEARAAAERSLAERANEPREVARWLVAKGALSAYQSKVLLSGRRGPFFIGDFKLIEPIDAVRMPSVFRAKHIPTRHVVSLRALKPADARVPEVLASLKERVAAAYAVTALAPHVADCYFLADEATAPVIVAESLDGESLAEHLKSMGAIEHATACHYARQVALALAELHAAGAVHGDVRPSNIWLQASGRVLLAWFPFSRDPLGPTFFSGLGAATAEELDYLAPELASRHGHNDARSDLYALGCALYHLLSGSPPFPDTEAAAKLGRHVADQPRPLADFANDIPPTLAKLVQHLMAKNPDLRYQQASSVAQALAAWAVAPSAGSAEIPPDSRQRFLAHLHAANLLRAPNDVPSSAREGARVASQEPREPAYDASDRQPEPLSRLGTTPIGEDSSTDDVAVSGISDTARERFDDAIDELPSLNARPGAATVLARSRRAAQRARRRKHLGLATLAVAAVVGLGAWGFVAWRTPATTTFGPVASNASAVNNPPVAVDSPAIKNEPRDNVTVADADVTVPATPAAGNAPRASSLVGLDVPLWGAPQQGQPLDLRYLAPGAQAIVVLRPADLAANAEGAKLLDKRVLGRAAEWVATDLPRIVGIPLASLEQVVIGLSADSDGYDWSLVAHIAGAASESDLLTAWDNPLREEIEGREVYVAGERAYYLPEEADRKCIVIAPKDLMGDIVKAKGPPPLRLEIEVLCAKVDARWQAAAIFVPYFLSHSAHTLFAPPADRVMSGWEWFVRGAEESLTVDDESLPTSWEGTNLTWPKAAMLGMALGERLFVEMRLYDSSDPRPAIEIAGRLAQRADAAPKSVDRWVRDLDISPYSYDVLYEFPSMVRACREYVRFGGDERQVVVRAIWPLAAAHNLALGFHLALSERPRQNMLASNGPATAPRDESVADKLRHKTSLRFPRNTLEQALQLLGDDIGVPVVILGADLQLEGITKNQSFGLDEQDQPASAILTKIMALADTGGRLVWLIKPDEMGRETVHITTRAAVQTRGETLPPEMTATN